MVKKLFSALGLTTYKWYIESVPISGKEMLKLYKQKGWIEIRQNGSHVRVAKDSENETIPMHKELKRGMEHYLLKRLKEVG